MTNNPKKPTSGYVLRRREIVVRKLFIAFMLLLCVGVILYMYLVLKPRHKPELNPAESAPASLS